MPEEYTLLNSIVIGAAGGSIVGITVYLFKYIHDKVSDRKKRVALFQTLGVK